MIGQVFVSRDNSLCHTDNRFSHTQGEEEDDERDPSAEEEEEEEAAEEDKEEGADDFSDAALAEEEDEWHGTDMQSDESHSSASILISPSRVSSHSHASFREHAYAWDSKRSGEGKSRMAFV